MRTIERTGQFKKDFRREAKRAHRATLAANLVAIVEALANDRLLAGKRRDHARTDDLKDHRDCHINRI
jgi:mRNA interferase YafQ